MAASYPASLPVKDPAGANLSTNPHAVLHDGMYDEIVAIATELGTNPKGTAASVKARLDRFDIGAWTSHTPTVSQGVTSNVSKTVNYSKWVRADRAITWTFHLTITSPGTSGSVVELTMPVAAVAVSAIVGSGFCIDASVQGYAGAWIGSTTTTIVFETHANTAGGGFGVAPNIALASPDELFGSITFEAAS